MSDMSEKRGEEEQQQQNATKLEPVDEPIDQEQPMDHDSLEKPQEVSREDVNQEIHQAEEEDEEEDEGGEGGEGVEGGSGETRCVCGNSDEESYGFMIQCETCGCWQHGVCVGLVEEKYAPETYYCEECRPDMHPIVIPGRPGRKPARLTQQRRELKQKSPINNTSNNPNPSRRRSSSSIDTAERARSPKRRSTLNSRDAAYDDAIAASLLDVQNDSIKSQIAEKEKHRWLHYGPPSQQEDEQHHDNDDNDHHPHDPTHPDELEQPEHPPQPEPDHTQHNDSKDLDKEGDLPQQSESDPPTYKDKTEPAPDSEADYKPRSKSESKSTRGRGGKRKDQGRNSTAAKSKSKEKSVVSGVNDEDDRNENSKRSASPPPATDERDQRAPPRGYKKRRRETDESNNEEGFTPPATANGPKRTANGSRKDKQLQSPQKRKGGTKDKEKKQSFDDESSLYWNLPDHLQHLSHLLPTEQPEMLALRIPHGSSTSSMDTVKELPTRVKFPSKRMTIGEMKRRVRSVLEYVGRVQIEAAEKPAPPEVTEDGKAPESIQMLDDLTRELIRFNDKFSTSTKRREEEED
ncbi:hypothetical protein E3P92_01815 [Wallemia ichthyophaga]|uniref:PHD-type domain-containing protein n=1 Tax=Wallemia ichthyophaga TaxID=245174 RepID=A0A4T0HNJ8_WALIC|nr:hypothetical protein E3P98_00474 [Wallemia ichthyophaga]TIA90366.1 hypothetical protein E3P97_02583 [Wallemia ichthyophaga]TIA96760.1 hypothetical protein E3P96_03536 [Wallemia ichthyophaga]TIB01190.1 hypothetical protein E3P95_01372 [Wallemia ichthyophaga]TIB02142.1 hypothetical protein E3P94_01504 [Wallemia ichthyophaga]